MGKAKYICADCGFLGAPKKVKNQNYNRGGGGGCFMILVGLFLLCGGALFVPVIALFVFLGLFVISGIGMLLGNGGPKIIQNGYQKAFFCPKCFNQNIFTLDTPRGQQLYAQFSDPSLPPQLPGDEGPFNKSIYR